MGHAERASGTRSPSLITAHELNGAALLSRAVLWESERMSNLAAPPSRSPGQANRAPSRINSPPPSSHIAPAPVALANEAVTSELTEAPIQSPASSTFAPFSCGLAPRPGPESTVCHGAYGYGWCAEKGVAGAGVLAGEEEEEAIFHRCTVARVSQAVPFHMVCARSGTAKLLPDTAQSSPNMDALLDVDTDTPIPHHTPPPRPLGSCALRWNMCADEAGEGVETEEVGEREEVTRRRWPSRDRQCPNRPPVYPCGACTSLARPHPACVFVGVCVCVCVRARVFIYIHTHTHINTYINTCIDRYIHTHDLPRRRR